MNNSNVATSMKRLVFPNGVANLTIRTDESLPGIYRGEFQGPRPQVTETSDAVTIDYPRFNPMNWGRTSAEVTLNPASTWRIEIDGGVSRWSADLKDLELVAIDVRGGVSRAELRLPVPHGSVPVRISGGASGLTVRRPAGVPARVQIGGGASKLGLDQQFLGAVGGPVRLESPGYQGSEARYEVEIGGGASHISVDHD